MEGWENGDHSKDNKQCLKILVIIKSMVHSQCWRGDPFPPHPKWASVGFSVTCTQWVLTGMYRWQSQDLNSVLCDSRVHKFYSTCRTVSPVKQNFPESESLEVSLGKIFTVATLRKWGYIGHCQEYWLPRTFVHFTSSKCNFCLWAFLCPTPVQQEFQEGEGAGPWKRLEGRALNHSRSPIN